MNLPHIGERIVLATCWLGVDLIYCTIDEHFARTTFILC